jgi:glycosidase
VRKVLGVALPALAGALAVAAAAAGGGRQAADPTALALPAVRTSIASQRIYFAMTDRYANGNPNNDRGGRTGARGETGYDPTDPGWFHGGDFAGLTGNCTDTRRGLARLRQLGFTSIWITPPFGQKYVQGDSAAYHGYWAVNFAHVDPHLGTDADFAAFVSCAHRLGLRVIVDALVNHTADVIELSPGGYVPPADAPDRDCAGNPFNARAYVFADTFPCLSPATMPRMPSVTPAEQAIKEPAWLNDVTNYHDRGNIPTSCDQECQEYGDFFGLDDLFTEQPDVMTGLAQIYADWIHRYRFDGFRIDTARHVNPEFFRLWVPRVLAAARAAGVGEFEIFGEAFIRDGVALSTYVRDRGLPNVLDFPLQEPAVRFAAGVAGSSGIASRFADDDYYALPSGVVHTPPTFLGNHDIGRAALNILAVGASRARLLERVLLGHSLLYLLRGAPVVYYGDEVGIIGGGGDKAARQDLFPTRVREWQTDPRVGSAPIGTRSSFDIVNHPISRHLRALALLRERHPALATGASHVRGATRTWLAVSRIDQQARREYLALFNNSRRAVRVRVRTATPSTRWAPLLGTKARPTSRRDGSLTAVVPPLRAVLLRAMGRIPDAPAAAPRLTQGEDSLSDLWRVTATVRGVPASVTFTGQRRGSAEWERIAVDDSPPYRAFIRRSDFQRVAAVMLALDGSKAASQPLDVSAVARRNAHHGDTERP